MTRTKVAGYLFARMMVTTCGDVTAAAIVAAPNASLARARLFYACTQLLRIQQCYVEAIKDLLPSGAINTTKVCWDKSGTWIATRPCPTPRAMREVVQSMGENLDTLRPYDSLEAYIEYHNLYTLYTLFYCSFATSMRPIRSPLFFPNEIECDPNGEGIAYINDKDMGGGYNARLAWVPCDLARQVSHYAIHLSSVCRELLFRHGEASVKRRQLLFRSCFFLDHSMQPVEVSEGNLEAHMRRFFHFPANIHRRYISSELLHRGVASEAVDWWMGHWHLGEEPWGRYSGLSLAEYRTQLRPLLDVLAKLGFRCKRSALALRRGA